MQDILEWNYNDQILENFWYPFTTTVMLFRGARATGKTYNMVRNIVLKAHKEHVSVLVVRNTLESLEDSCYAEIKEALDELQIKYHATKSPLRIVTQQGVKFAFRGIDKADKIKSIKLSPRIGIVWFEEATEIESEENVRKLMLSVRTGERYYVFTYNPENPRHWIRSWEEQHGVNVTTCFDNPFNDDIFYKELDNIKENDYKEWEKIALGKWVESGKSVFPVTKENVFEQADSTYPMITFGIDLGENDATTFVATGFKAKFKGVDVIEQYHFENAKCKREVDKKYLTEYVDDFVNFYNYVKKKYPSRLYLVWVESAAQGSTFIHLLKQKGITNIKKVDKKLFTIPERVQAIRYMVAKRYLKMADGLPLYNALLDATRDPLAKNNDFYCKDTADAHSRDALSYSIMMHMKYLQIPKAYFKKKPPALDEDGNEMAYYDAERGVINA